MALVGMTGSDEGKLRGGESIASGKGVVVQQTPSGFAPLSGHGVGVQVRIGQDRQWRIDGGWPNSRAQGKNGMGEPRNSRAQGEEKAKEQSSTRQRWNGRAFQGTGLHSAWRIDRGECHES
jgi:hypothetical protein